MSFRTPNSSFILDLLRLSIRLCAVFRAIFRPATLVEEGCFFLVPAAFGVDDVSATSSGISSGCPRGFICMIFRDLVGGGGRAKASFEGACAVEDLRRILTASPMAGDVGEVGRYDEEDFPDEPLDGRASAAGGGSSKDIKDENWLPSFPLISVEEAGVGGC